jgi:L-lactate dehydrogenase complex protein LldE
MVKNFYPELLGDNFNSIRDRIFELTQFIVNVLGTDSIGAKFNAKVTYHDSCHALREINIKNEPRRLLKNVKGLELIEMENSEICCGFGGTFSVKFPEISIAMAEEKVNFIRLTNAEFVTSTDSSCLMQIDGFLKRNKIPIKTIHIAEILANF